MRDEQILRQEFSYIPPEIERYHNRFTGIENGNCLGALLYTMQAMLGYGHNLVDMVQGVLKMNLAQPHNKRYSPMYIKYPTPYVDVRLEQDYKNGRGLDCDLTFWAVQFENLVETVRNNQM